MSAKDLVYEENLRTTSSHKYELDAESLRSLRELCKVTDDDAASSTWHERILRSDLELYVLRMERRNVVRSAIRQDGTVAYERESENHVERGARSIVLRQGTRLSTCEGSKTLAFVADFINNDRLGQLKFMRDGSVKFCVYGG